MKEQERQAIIDAMNELQFGEHIQINTDGEEMWCDRRLQDDEFINYRDEGIKSFNAEANTYRLYDEHIGNMSENDEKKLFNDISKKLEGSRRKTSTN